MVDEIKLQRQRGRGAEAKRLLENSLYKESFEITEKRLMEAWRSSVAGEEDVRERMYLMLRLLDELKQVLKTVMYTGDLAMKDLLEIEQRVKETRQ